MNLLAEKIEADIYYNKIMSMNTECYYEQSEEIELWEMQNLTPSQIKELTEQFFNRYLYDLEITVKGINDKIKIIASGYFDTNSMLDTDIEFKNDLDNKFDNFININLIN